MRALSTAFALSMAFVHARAVWELGHYAPNFWTNGSRVVFCPLASCTCFAADSQSAMAVEDSLRGRTCSERHSLAFESPGSAGQASMPLRKGSSACNILQYLAAKLPQNKTSGLRDLLERCLYGIDLLLGLLHIGLRQSRSSRGPRLLKLREQASALAFSRWALVVCFT